MSETQTISPPGQVKPDPVARQALLISAPGSDSPATQATAAASGTAALSAVVIISWILSFWHIDVPTDVASAMTVLLGIVVHFVGLKVMVQTKN